MFDEVDEVLIRVSAYGPIHDKEVQVVLAGVVVDAVGDEADFGSKIIGDPFLQKKLFFDGEKLLLCFFFYLLLQLKDLARSGRHEAVCIQNGKVSMELLGHRYSPCHGLTR